VALGENYSAKDKQRHSHAAGLVWHRSIPSFNTQLHRLIFEISCTKGFFEGSKKKLIGRVQSND
jgi:hypothetical protein